MPWSKTHWILQSYGSPSEKLLNPGFISKFHVVSHPEMPRAHPPLPNPIILEYFCIKHHNSFAGWEPVLGSVPCTEPGLFLPLSHSDPSLDPTKLSECWDFNGAPAPSTWDPWSIPKLSHSSLCSPVLPWNSARPATPSSGTSDKTAALPLTNPWKPGQRAGNAAQGAHWQGGKAVISHSSLRWEVLGIRGAGIVGITAPLT